MTYQLGAISTPADVDENKTGVKSITKNRKELNVIRLRLNVIVLFGELKRVFNRLKSVDVFLLFRVSIFPCLFENTKTDDQRK